MKIIAAIVLLLASPTTASVVHADNHGFEVSQSVDVRLSASDALAAFTRVSSWWMTDHTYSGNPANLSLDPRPGGCLCEKLPGGGGVEHLRVTYFEPGKILILTGAMGPLLHEAVNGVLIVHADEAQGGSRVTIDYRASGFFNGGGEKFAAMVDRMLGDSIGHYKKFADSSRK
ncbi:MAG: ATPase [Sphingomicrobium sp.]